MIAGASYWRILGVFKGAPVLLVQDVVLGKGVHVLLQRLVAVVESVFPGDEGAGEENDHTSCYKDESEG